MPPSAATLEFMAECHGVSLATGMQLSQRGTHSVDPATGHRPAPQSNFAAASYTDSQGNCTPLAFVALSPPGLLPLVRLAASMGDQEQDGRGLLGSAWSVGNAVWNYAASTVNRRDHMNARGSRHAVLTPAAGRDRADGLQQAAGAAQGSPGAPGRGLLQLLRLPALLCAASWVMTTLTLWIPPRERRRPRRLI